MEPRHEEETISDEKCSLSIVARVTRATGVDIDTSLEYKLTSGKRESVSELNSMETDEPKKAGDR